MGGAGSAEGHRYRTHEPPAFSAVPAVPAPRKRAVAVTGHAVALAPRDLAAGAAPTARRLSAGQGHAAAKCASLQSLLRGKPGNAVSPEAKLQAKTAFDKHCGAPAAAGD
jgi:hypothetical protein